MSPIITSPLIITPGEPAGIGTEIALKAWQAGMRDICLMGNPDHIGQTAQSLGIDVNFYEIVNPSSYSFDPSALAIIPISWKKTPVPGRPDSENAPMVIEAIRQAVFWSQSGTASGLVTNPIQKSSLYKAGFTFPGHTEYLSSLSTTVSGGPLMMRAAVQARAAEASALRRLPLSLWRRGGARLCGAARRARPTWWRRRGRALLCNSKCLNYWCWLRYCTHFCKERAQWLRPPIQLFT